MKEVFVVVMSTKGLHPTFKVGAVYTDKAEATREVERLRAANSYTLARWVSRQVEEHRKPTMVGWGHE